MSTLATAMAIAATAHAGQIDRAGAPYILHSLRVMLRLAGNSARIVGVLHDVIEDCPEWTFDRLRAEGYAAEIIDALQSVTKRPGEDYMAFVDNSDKSRIAAPTARDYQRLAKYQPAMAYLRDHGDRPQ